jgi:hypothetical protein
VAVAYLFLVRRKRVKPFVLITILASSALSAAVAADEQRQIAATVDQFCSWTGLKRVSELRDVGHWKSLHDSGGNARFDLLVDGKRTHYRMIFFWQHGRAKIYSIEPENYDWHGHGVGFDTLKDPKIRQWAEAAAKKVNAHLKWKYAFGPEIQRIGRDIAVTYETVPREKPTRMKKSYVGRAQESPSPATITKPAPTGAAGSAAEVERVIVTGSNIPTDPYITFLVSPKGTVFSAFMNS